MIFFTCVSLLHDQRNPSMPKKLIPLKFEVIFNYETFFKVAQSYMHGPKLAQLTVPFWLTFTPFLIWHDRSFLMKSCSKVTPIGYAKSRHAPRIYRNLWGKAQNLCQKWIQGARKPQSTKNKNCCKMLQKVARCCKPLYLGTRMSHNLKNYRIKNAVPKLP